MNELMDFKFDKRAAPAFANYGDSDYRAEFKQVLAAKMKQIKTFLKQTMKTRQLRHPGQATKNDWLTEEQLETFNNEYDIDGGLNRTNADFKLIEEDWNTRASFERFQGVYCYDILSNPDYKHILKLLKKVEKLNKQIRRGS